MNKTFLILKIIALMAVVFTSGILVGRATYSPEVVVLANPEGRSLATTGNMSPMVYRVFGRHAETLELTVEQQLEVAPLFKEMGERVRMLPKHSPERIEEIRILYERMAPFLNEKQNRLTDKILEASRAKADRREE